MRTAIFVILTVVNYAYTEKSEKRNFIPYELPEIIANSATGQNGYNYPIPNPPFNIEEPQNQYIPVTITENDHIAIPTYIPPVLDIQPPFFEPLPTIEIPIQPPGYLPPSTSYGVPFNTPPNVKILNMSCLDDPNRRFFKVAFSALAFNGFPVVEDAKMQCVIGQNGFFNLDVDGFRMSKCGVKYCGLDKNLCAQVRVPLVRGLKLPEDALITLQCKPQEVVVEKTRHYRINPQYLQARSAGTVATGGAQRNFDTDVAIYRKSPGSPEFSQLVTPGSVVQLGEDLLLRATVREGDGWKYSRIGSVVMQRVLPGPRNSPGSSAVTLVDSQGCRVPAMKSICPEQPRQINPLTTTMQFRAFMFQGAQSGDEMVLSVRMLGCLHYEDCYKTHSCEEKVRARSRRRRSVKTGASNATSDWKTILEFRVAVPGSQMPETINKSTNLGVVWGLGVVSLVGSLLILLFVVRKRI